MIDLQYWFDFCYTSTRINHRCTYVYSLLRLPPTSDPFSFLQVIKSPSLSSLNHTENFHWISILHMFVYMLPCHFFLLILSFLSLPLSISLFSMSASSLLPCEQVHQYHLSRSHIYALVNDICFSLSDLLQFLYQALGHPPHQD